MALSTLQLSSSGRSISFDAVVDLMSRIQNTTDVDVYEFQHVSSDSVEQFRVDVMGAGAAEFHAWLSPVNDELATERRFLVYELVRQLAGTLPYTWLQPRWMYARRVIRKWSVWLVSFILAVVFTNLCTVGYVHSSMVGSVGK